jgi:hypothetical protein
MAYQAQTKPGAFKIVYDEDGKIVDIEDMKGVRIGQGWADAVPLADDPIRDATILAVSETVILSTVHSVTRHCWVYHGGRRKCVSC